MSIFRQIPPAYEHQQKTTEFILNTPAAYVANDPGTGKTRSCLDAIVKLKNSVNAKRTLVFAPKSILKPSWFDDASYFTPELGCEIAYAKNRKDAFKSSADVVITNHDAAKWVAENKAYLDDFDILISDEHTAYKHRTSQRSKAMASIAPLFGYRIGMSGTMVPNGIMDIWHQILILDQGEHLGNNFFRFRNMVCEPEQVGRNANAIKWHEKPGANEAVMDLLSEMMIRYRLEDCIEMPQHTMRVIEFQVPNDLRAHYEKMRKTALLQYEEYTVNAVHAASLRTKLLQIASGAVYDTKSDPFKLSSKRYELVMDLAEERNHCLISFVWRHQLEGLKVAADRRGFSYAVIDGTVNINDRITAVERFQAGDIKIIFAHPQSAGHGLTLTRGTTTIWPSPIDNAELFTQFNARIYRNGQTERTETLMISAADTLESEVYDNLTGKVNTMGDLLSLLDAA